MTTEAEGTTLHVLLVEDSAGDARLTKEAFLEANSSVHLHVAADGLEAMAYLKSKQSKLKVPRPEIILLDLNLPKMDGREVLALIKGDPELSLIPTIILTTSTAENDIAMSYELRANCYLTKPVELEAFESLVKSISDFWLTKAQLPKPRQNA